MYSTREEVENWLIEMRVENYVINEDLTVDVNGSVNISFKKLKEIPIQFGMVNGDFFCYKNKLTNLEGCPKEVVNLNCSENELISLKGCSEIVNGSFNCDRNKLTSLEGCSEVINGDFYCSNNRLTILEGSPREVNGNFDCSNNKLTSFKYFPKEINGNSILIYNNNIKEEELLNFNFNIENVKLIYSDFNGVTVTKEEFLERMNYYKNIKKENELLTDISKNSNNVKLNKKL